ncbi:MAG TPA: FtsK/SpoIIIE domain-containing protein [Mycobacteriales bacterium]|nr:FtsK/SpoIIIE domain-containing protein [Mycobacteriales bacterium]
MDIQLTAVDARSGRWQDIVLVLEPESTVADAERALRSSLGVEAMQLAGRMVGPPGSPGAPGGLWVAGRPVRPDLPVGVSPLREGVVVGLGGPVGLGIHDPDVGGVVEIRVVSGPDSGRVHRLPLGEYVLGSAHDADAYVEDPTVSARQARLLVTPNELRWTPFDEARPARLEGKKITAERLVKPGQVVAIGNTRLMAWPAEAPDAALVATTDGGLAYNRPPRLAPAPKATRVDMPIEPKDGGKRPIPILATLAPLAFGFLMYAVTKQITFLMFTLLSPILMVTNVISERRQGKKSQKQQLIDYKVALAEATKRLAQAASLERRLRRFDAPDPATVLVTALGPRRRLWERRSWDPDRLLLRLGTARLRSSIEVTGGSLEDNPEPPMLDDVPVTVELPETGGVLGVAGPHREVHATARWLVAQAATLHSPRDLSIVVLSDDRGEADWGWTRWLPHTRPDGRECVSLTSTSAEATARRISELAGMVGQRQSALEHGRKMDLSRVSVTLVVLDGARALRSIPGMPQILQDGPAVGVYAICLDAEERLLPEECGVVASYKPADLPRMTVRRAYGVTVEDVLADSVSTGWADRVARAMTAIRDVSRDEGDSSLPHSLRLLDVLELEPPEPNRLLAGWSQGHGRSTYAAIGASAEGRYGVDMKKDGPHALVAGTTGAGKSELLQSIIAALAVANRPDAMTFVLIDYKGGAAFKDCVHLPHTVGMVTDLDGHLTERALQSLNAELKRREHLLGGVGAKDVEDYWDTIDAPGFQSADGQPPDPMPRTILIIDEFASLVEELPEFVTGLVGIAMRGRSLGVHLILATQRPSGVVSPVIRANTNLRIALRVTDDAESTDVIDAKDAARINKSNPGRGYARTGFSALTAFQAGRVGGRRPGAVAGPPPAIAVPIGWEQLGAPIERPVSVEDDSNMETDLQVLVGSIQQAAHQAGIPTYRSPWLPALPNEIALAELPALAGPAAGDTGRVSPVPFGIEDLPDAQLQVPLVLDLEHGSHLIVAGAPRSGRSTALRTLAGSIAQHTSCRDVHMYVLDCGNAAMLPLADLPHCGAVVTRDQVDRVDRLLTVLVNEISRRQVVLAQYGYGSLAEQRAGVAPEERLPYLLLLLDRWEGFMATFDELDAGRLTQSVLRILREGPGVGLRAVVAGDRSTLLGRLPTAIEDKLVMRMGDRNDYGLGGLSTRKMPDSMPPGRAFRNDSMIEAHFALLDPDPSGPAQVAALAQLARAARERDSVVPRRHRPQRVDVLPARITFREALALTDEPRPASPLWALVGVGGDELIPLGVDLDDDGPGFVVGGPPRSGRSTTLLTMAAGLLDGGCELVVVTPRQSPLRRLAGRPGVLGVLSGVATTEQDVLALLDEALGPAVVMVDDAELLTDSPCAGAFETVLREGRDGQRALVVGGTTGEMINGYRGFIVEARKTKSGLLINAEHPLEGDLLGIKPPRSAVGPAPKGRGLLVTRGTFLPAQVPLPPD